MSPRRIQLRRTTGWRKPEGAIVVGRPSRWGNPFTIAGAIESGYAEGTSDARSLVRDCFANWLVYGPKSEWWFAQSADAYRYMSERIRDLRDHDLACWCPLDQPCHADVLLKVANS